MIQVGRVQERRQAEVLVVGIVAACLAETMEQQEVHVG